MRSRISDIKARTGFTVDIVRLELLKSCVEWNPGPLSLFERDSLACWSVAVVRIRLFRAGVELNPGPGLHETTEAVCWQGAPWTGNSKADSFNLLSRLSLPWRSCPLAWDHERGKKKGICQPGGTDPNATGFYLRCADGGISVVDLDSCTPQALEVLSTCAGRCNLVALTPRGVHLFFAHTQGLPKGFASATAKVDVRSFDNKSSDLILVEPSAYSKGQETLRYRWLCVPPVSAKLLPCPDDLVSLILGFRHLVAPCTAPTSRVNAAVNKPDQDPEGTSHTPHRRIRKQRPQPVLPPKPPKSRTIQSRGGSSLRVLSWNCRSLDASSCAELVETLAVQHVDVALLQEIHAPTVETMQRFSGFDCFWSPARNHGLAILMRKTSFICTELLPPVTLARSTAIAVAAYVGTRRIVLVSAYSPPNAADLDHLLHQIEHVWSPHLVGADFNSRHPSWEPGLDHPSTRGNTVANYASSAGFSVIHSGAHSGSSRRRGRGLIPDTTPDVMLCRANMSVLQRGFVQLQSSDHVPLLATLNCEIHTPMKDSFRRLPLTAWGKVTATHKEYFQAAFRDLTVPTNQNATIDDLSAIITTTIVRASACLPRGRVAQVTRGWDSALDRQRREVQKMQCEGHPDATNACADFLQALAHREDHITAAAATSYPALQRREKHPGPTGPIVNSDGERVTTARRKAHLFGELFSRKCERLLHAPVPPMPLFGAPPPPVTMCEIVTAIAAHPPGKAADPDDIQAEHLRLLPPIALDALQTLFNKSLELGCLPTRWLSSTCCPILKEGKPSADANSYRPVAITSVLCRTLERILLRRIEASLVAHIGDDQYGFRRGISTEFLLGDLVQEIKPSVLDGSPCVVAAFDFTDAFCRVDPSSLSALLLPVIDSYAVQWIVNFMTGRTMRVAVAGRMSCTVPLTLGVPQGSVLGPILWNVFIAPLIKSLRNLEPSRGVTTRPFGYADDLTVAIRGTRSTHVSKVNTTLSRVVDCVTTWATRNDVQVSQKTQFVGFGKAAKLHVYLHGKSQPMVAYTRILGLLIDQRLVFTAHVDKLCQKLSSLASTFARWRKTLHPQGMREAFRGLALSRIRFGLDTYWPQLCIRDRSKLETALSVAAKSALGLVSSTRHLCALQECGTGSLEAQATRLTRRRVVYTASLPATHPTRIRVQKQWPFDAEVLPTLMHSHVNPASTGGWDKISFDLGANFRLHEEESLVASKHLASCAAISRTPPGAIAELWTDGSGRDIRDAAGVLIRRGTGAAAQLYHYNVIEPHQNRRNSTGPLACSFISEMHALLLGLKSIPKGMSGGGLLICSDSLSSLSTLLAGPIAQRNVLGADIWKQLLSLVASQFIWIRLTFVYGHCCLFRGDKVDLEARHAAEDPPPESGIDWWKDALRHPKLPPCPMPAPDSDPHATAAPQRMSFRARWWTGASPPPPSLTPARARLLYQLRVGVCVPLGGWRHGTSTMEPCPVCGQAVLNREAEVHPVAHLFECSAAKRLQLPLPLLEDPLAPPLRFTPALLWREPEYALSFVERCLTILHQLNGRQATVHLDE
jgi:hypothetical protein